MKKGFTLMELLAVIVILAVIALITLPNVTNILNDSQNKIDDVNIFNYYKAVQKSILEQEMDGTVAPGTYTIMSGTQICLDTNSNDTCDVDDGEISITIKATGTKVTSGTVVIENTGDVSCIDTKISNVVYKTDGTDVVKSTDINPDDCS